MRIWTLRTQQLSVTIVRGEDSVAGGIIVVVAEAVKIEDNLILGQSMSARSKSCD